MLCLMLPRDRWWLRYLYERLVLRLEKELYGSTIGMLL